MGQLAILATSVFVFMVPWENVVVIPGFGTAARLVGGIAVLVGGLSVLIRGRVRWHPFHVVSLLFVLWSLASMLWSIDVAATVLRATTYATLWLLMLIVYQVAIDERTCRHLMFAYVLGSWVAACAVIEGYVHSLQAASRYTASGFNPNDVALYLCLAIPMARYLGHKLQGRFSRALAWGVIPAAVLGILLTGSRSGALGCALALSYVFLSLSRLGPRWRIGATAAVVGGVMVAASLVPSEVYTRLGTLPGEALHGTLNARTVIWSAGAQVFAGSPLLGVGAGAFPSAVATILGAALAPHSAFLAVAAETGLVGLALWSGMMLILLRSALHSTPARRLAWLTLLAILLLAFSVLNFEWRKASWLVMTMALAHATTRATDTTDGETNVSAALLPRREKQDGGVLGKS